MPTSSNPRSGCWASPAPAPSPVGTWSRKVSDAETTPASPMDFDITIQEVIHEKDQLGPRRHVSEAMGVAPSSKEQPHKALPTKADGDFRLVQMLSPAAVRPSMSPQEREKSKHDQVERAIQKLKPGMTVNEKVAAVPRRLLVMRGPDGQGLRRAVLRGSTIVWFTTGYEGKRFVYERAQALGVRSIVLESSDSWSKDMLRDGIISKFVPIDMSQSIDGVYAQAFNAIQRLRQDPTVGEIDGIATVVELSVPLVSRLAEALNLPGHNPDAVDLARDKWSTRGALVEAGLPTPPYCAIDRKEDLEKAARKVGFPAVLKPRGGAASLGVKKVASKADLLSVYEEVRQELSSLVVSSGALVKGDEANNGGVKADEAIDLSLLLEKYLDGDEVDVDVVMSEGEWKYAAVSDNGPTLEPYFNETWAVSPSLLSREKQVALKELAIGSVKALGFTDGVFHVECKYTSIGPHLIEVNARMGGGPVYATNLRTWNVCLVEETIFAAVGIPSRPDVPREPHQCIANSDVNALKSGKLLDLKFLDPLRGREGVVSFSPHVGVGEEVCGPSDGMPTWLVEIVVAKPTPREALDFLFQLESEVQALVNLS